MPSRKPKKPARFNVRFSAGPLTGRDFSVGPGELLYIGSDPACGIRVEGDPTIAPRHACLHMNASGHVLFKDLATPHGTQVNGRRIKRTVRLRSGDFVTLGQSASFQGGSWNALEPSRFTRIALLKVSAIARRSSRLIRRRVSGSERTTTLALALAACAVIAVALTWYLSADRNSDSEQRIGRRDTDRRSSGSLTARLLPRDSQARPAASAGDAGEAGESNDLPQANPNQHFVWDEIVNISRRFGDAPPSVMDRNFVALVEMWIERFARNDAHRVLLRRREEYWPTIEAALRANNLPVELGYVVWVESAFIRDAESPVGARGLWQFMPETAKEYGLRVIPERRIDDRLDPVKSSEAAAAYITMLLRMFGTDRYLLALASYNTGQNRVERRKIAAAVRRARRADFWHIHQELPQETVDYVPKILAAIIVARNPDRW